MVEKFNPPLIDELAAVDVSGCAYAAAVSEIIGVVSQRGQGGWPKCSSYEVHVFEFAAWRRADQPLHDQPLTILRPVQDVRTTFSDFEPSTVHRLQVLISTDQTRAVFAEKIDSPEDDELEAIAKSLLEPVIIHTDQFGSLTLDRRINWFEGTVDWNGQSIALHICPDDNLNLTNQLESAACLFADSQGWNERVRQFAVKENLELANDWQEEEITADEFLQRMTLESISIGPEDHFEFWHHDGELFGGHSILIRGSLKEGLTEAVIAG